MSDNSSSNNNQNNRSAAHNAFNNSADFSAEKSRNHNLGSWILPIVLLFTPLMPIGIVILISKLIAVAKTAPVEYYQNTKKTAQTESDRHVRQETHERERQEARERGRTAAANAAETVRASVVRENRGSTTSSRLNDTRRKMKNGRIALYVFGILFAVPSFVLFCVSAVSMFNGWFSFVFPIVGASFTVVSLFFFFMGSILPRRINRYQSYLAHIGNNKVVLIRNIARSSGKSVNLVKKDLETMIHDGWFPDSAYIDNSIGAFVLHSSAMNDYLNRDAAAPKPKQREAEAADSEQSVDEYEQILRSLRKLNDDIDDEVISDKIERIELISAKIFAAVREKPEKLPQIRRMMNYYLPTTLKLLQQYAVFEKQGIDGGNIGDAKSRIDGVLGTLADGFERQLNQLYLNDVIDISADINVLENMMARDGLSGGSVFGSASAAAFEQDED